MGNDVVPRRGDRARVHLLFGVKALDEGGEVKLGGRFLVRPTGDIKVSQLAIRAGVRRLVDYVLGLGDAKDWVVRCCSV